MLKIKKESTTAEGFDIYSLENDVLRLTVTNLGCRILSLYAPDREGNCEDVLLGLNDLTDVKNDTAYFGAVIGRVANRIKNATFSLNDKTYTLAANNNGNHLHGGLRGFDKRVFDARPASDGIIFTYRSADGEEGYPGNLDVTVGYSLKGNALNIRYEAVSDKDTIVNLTNHMYFNLSGGKRDILDHTLRLAASKVALVDENCMSTGEIISVSDTPFDFRNPRPVRDGARSDHPSIIAARGLDHPYVLDKGPDQIDLSDPESGRTLTISTDAPSVQVYSGNYLSGAVAGKSGKPYDDYFGIALETQILPNAINSPDREKVILRAGETFTSETTYTFRCDRGTVLLSHLTTSEK
ncbi:MAG: galactose mutarotase [Lachnospiraceae bacterium]|nr:galactose mutarotase [Lachnospiraceae bacterium]